MVEIEDLDSYREYNDIGPEEPAPREPQGEADADGEQFRVWVFDAEESEVVPDVFVVAKDPSPLDFRMWVFVGRGETAQFSMRASHRYPEDVVIEGGREDCCEVLFAGESLTAAHCPQAVERLVQQITGAEVLLPPEREPGEDGSPINY